MENEQNEMIDDVYNILFKYCIKNESMTLIVLIMILQAKATDHWYKLEQRATGRDIAKVCYIAIQNMYDDIVYSNNDFQKTDFIRA